MKTGRRIGARRKNKISRKDAKITAKNAKKKLQGRLFVESVDYASESVFDQINIEVDEQA